MRVPAHLPKAVLPVAFLALTATLGACASGGAARASGAPAASTPQLIAEGQALFTGDGRCGRCHGPTAQGGRGPDLTDDTWLWVDGEDDRHTQIFAVIKEGIAEPRGGGSNGMPAMGGATLTDAQIHALTFYIESL